MKVQPAKRPPVVYENGVPVMYHKGQRIVLPVEPKRRPAWVKTEADKLRHTKMLRRGGV